MGVQYHDIPSVPEGVLNCTDSLLDELPADVKHVITWLYMCGKDGSVPLNVIEHTLNRYLAVPGLVKECSVIARKPWMGIMFAADTPCVENLPDLWGVLRDTLQFMHKPKKKNVAEQHMLHILFMQALPCFHQTSRQYQVDENVTIALNVLMACLMGFYKNVNRKPHFMIRVKLFEQVHQVMTSTFEKQTKFFKKHPCLFMLAFMEYIAQITPLYWPVEYDFLLRENNLHFFFERVPLICDEFRIMEIDKLSWKELEENADAKIHKCSRAKRINKCMVIAAKHKRMPCDVSVFLNCPVLAHDDTQSIEMTLLAHAYQIPQTVLQDGHKLIEVNALPKNIRSIQYQKMVAKHSCLRMRFISSRMFVCVQCVYNKKSIHSKFRLNMYNEELICSECLSEHVVSVDVMGRTVIINNSVFVVCCTCCKVHEYTGDQKNWVDFCCLQAPSSLVQEHKSYANKVCDVCEDSNYYGNPCERVNQLTGEMECVYFCYKHYPSHHILNKCTNIAQVKKLDIKRFTWSKKETKKIYNY